MHQYHLKISDYGDDKLIGMRVRYIPNEISMPDGLILGLDWLVNDLSSEQ